MAPLGLSCCFARGAACYPVKSVQPAAAPGGDAGAAAFFDCAETTAELAALWADAYASAGAAAKENKVVGRGPGRPECRDLRADSAGPPAAWAVLQRTREEWCQRVHGSGKAGPELEWADLSAARRMLQASDVDVQKAVEMFLQALEVRARYRKLFQTMHCQPCCDIRILARDLQEHPVIYMCCRSLNEPLRNLLDQFVVTFEAACRLTTKEGRVVFVMDMHGMRPHLYMDCSAVKDLAHALSSVFAERIFRIITVDFSRAAQAAWWAVKPLLTQKTRDKFAFVGCEKARQLCGELLSAADHQRLCSTFDINRDPLSSDAARVLHARRTTMCDVPLGPPLA